MHEKRGVIDPQHTKPEVPGEKDLTQHLTKRAADKVAKVVDVVDDLHPERNLRKPVTVSKQSAARIRAADAPKAGRTT